MISDDDVEKLASAARLLPPNTSTYLEEDFVMNLLETVLDYMLQTEVVVKALQRFRENRWDEVRTLDDLERLMARFSEDQGGKTELAQYLWGYNHWKRAQQLQHRSRRPTASPSRRSRSVATTCSSSSSSGAAASTSRAAPPTRRALGHPAGTQPQLHRPVRADALPDP
jgi:hypothetical protein